MADGGKGVGVVGVDDQPGDFIGLVGDQRFLQKVLERDIRQGHLRRYPLTVVLRGDTGQEVSGACRAGFGHDVLEVVEAVGLGAHAMGKTCHFSLRFK
ncbi:hypothetical protein D3C81_1817150 [compost metagenome]